MTASDVTAAAAAPSAGSRAPLEPWNGTVTLRILVDWSSAEAFGYRN